MARLFECRRLFEFDVETAGVAFPFEHGENALQFRHGHRFPIVPILDGIEFDDEGFLLIGRAKDRDGHGSLTDAQSQISAFEDLHHQAFVSRNYKGRNREPKPPKAILRVVRLRPDFPVMERIMLAWATAAGLVCALSAMFGFGSIATLPSSFQSIALFITAVAAFVLLASFEAHEAQGPAPQDGDD